MRHLREHQEKGNDLEEVEPCQAAAIVSFEDVAWGSTSSRSSVPVGICPQVTQMRHAAVIIVRQLRRLISLDRCLRETEGNHDLVYEGYLVLLSFEVGVAKPPLPKSTKVSTFTS